MYGAAHRPQSGRGGVFVQLLAAELGHRPVLTEEGRLMEDTVHRSTLYLEAMPTICRGFRVQPTICVR